MHGHQNIKKNRIVINCNIKFHFDINAGNKYLGKLLTYSMVHSPSSETNWFAASHEIPSVSLNPKVHYRTHKRPPTVSILGQPNPVRIPTLLKR